MYIYTYIHVLCTIFVAHSTYLQLTDMKCLGNRNSLIDRLSFNRQTFSIPSKQTLFRNTS